MNTRRSLYNGYNTFIYDCYQFKQLDDKGEYIELSSQKYLLRYLKTVASLLDRVGFHHLFL